MQDLSTKNITQGKRVLVVDDQKNIRHTLRLTLEASGIQVFEAENLREARSLQKKHLNKNRFDMFLLDIRLGDRESGLDFLKEISRRNDASKVVVISGEATVKDAFTATELGAFDYIEKPLSPERLMVTVTRCLSFNEIREDNEAMRARLRENLEFKGSSSLTKQLLEKALRIARTNTRALIIGESGSGKELIAKEIHRNSLRKDKPLIKINCAAIPYNLVESELFGHVRGAFTGATRDHKGVFERSDKGTLFLDEISELELGVQAKLLRVLQSGELQRVGSEKTVQTDVRVIAATNRDLSDMVEEGRFREDLYYRLNVVALRVPALRERPEDIKELAQIFLAEACQENLLGEKKFSTEALTKLASLHWRGNVRELRNYVEKIAILSDGILIRKLDELPSQDEEPGEQGLSSGEPFHFRCQMTTWLNFHEQINRDYIRFVLQSCGGNVSEAARVLQLERSYLHRLIKKLGVQKEIIVGS